MGDPGMRAYRIDRFGSVDGVVLGSRDDPRPGNREILLRVRATSLNYRDLMVLKRGGRGPTKLGVVPLSDGAGEVAAVGDGVSRFSVGDRVIGCFHPRWFGGPLSADYLTDRLGANLDGMLAEYAVFNEEAVVVLPSHLSFEEAATLPCAAVTAWVALTGHRPVTAGDTVLTQGSGGVSVFALQFAADRAKRDFGRSGVRDHDLPKMAPALEMPVGRFGLGERECPVDHRAQAM